MAWVYFKFLGRIFYGNFGSAYKRHQYFALPNFRF